MKKAREPKVESMVRGIWRIRVTEVGRSEDSHRDKTEQCTWYTYSRQCLTLSSIQFFVGLGAGGEIEAES